MLRKGRQLRSYHQPTCPHVNPEYSPEADNQLRMAAYEVLNAFVTNAAISSLPVVASLSDVILERLEQTVPMQQQIVSVEDRITLEELQTSLTSVLLVRISEFLLTRLSLRSNRQLCNVWKAKLNLEPIVS